MKRVKLNQFIEDSVFAENIFKDIDVKAVMFYLTFSDSYVFMLSPEVSYSQGLTKFDNGRTDLHISIKSMETADTGDDGLMLGNGNETIVFVLNKKDSLEVESRLIESGYIG